MNEFIPTTQPASHARPTIPHVMNLILIYACQMRVDGTSEATRQAYDDCKRAVEALWSCE